MSDKRARTHLHCTVNGKERDNFVADNMLLADYLREELALTGTKIGCDGGECGCCTVLIDGNPQHACLRLAAACQESEIETIESISDQSRMSAIQRGFHEKLGTQCGFCTPGMIMAAEALLRKNPNPTIDEIRLEGDCRIFEMEGMGSVKEKILHLDNESMRLQYSAVETKMPIEHLATMQVFKINESSCQLKWSTEIDPEIFAEAIHQGMLVSIEGIKAVIASEAEWN